MHTPTTMLALEHVAKYYGAHAAVDDLSLHLEAGEVVGLLGLNGAGKTTTLRLASGLLVPTSGTIRVAGVDLAAEPEAARAHLGFLPETPPLYPEMRVDDFLRFAARIRGVRRGLARALAAALTATHLQDVAHRRIGTLSHGFHKRIGIAQAIVHRPEVILLDEPTSGLDPVQILHMRDLIRRLRGRYTVLISSHILGEIHQMCDRILVLHQGRVAAEGTEAALAARVAGSRRVALTVRGDAPALGMALAACAEVVEHRVVETTADAVTAEVALRAGSHDGREALAAAVVGAGLGLRGLTEVQPELERIFLTLTGGVQASGHAAAAAGGAAAGAAGDGSRA